MTIRVLKSDETFSPSATVSGKKVAVKWTVKKDKNEKSPRYVVETTLDFSGVSQDELTLLAVRPIVIELQRQWRELATAKGSTATTVNPFASVNVKSAIVDATRRTADPAARAKSLLAKLSPAERKAIMAAFAAEQKPARKAS